jgi:hypothetical protein
MGDPSAQNLAFEALKNCKFGLAPLVEKELMAPLKQTYRLAWYNLKAAPAKLAQPDPSTVRWKWEGEVWADEVPLYPELECSMSPIAEALFPPELLQDWYESHAPLYKSLPASARQSLRALQLSNLLAQRKPALVLPTAFGSFNIENCELQSLASIQLGNIQTETTHAATRGLRAPTFATAPNANLESCDEVKSKIVGVARVRWADGASRFSANRTRVIKTYSLAQRDFADDLVMSDLIGYRVAVVAADSPGETDIFYRSALQTINGKTLPVAYENILRHEICEKIGSSVSADNTNVLLGALSDSTAIIRDILVPCIEDETRPSSQKVVALGLIRRLLDKVEAKKQSRVIEEKFFDLSLRYSRKEAIQFSERLASAPSEKAVASSVSFWRGVSKPQAVWAEEAIKTYRKHQAWSELDEMRFKLFTTRQKVQPRVAQSPIEILDEQANRQRPLDLSGFRRLPGFQPQVSFEYDFSQVFSEELGFFK